MSKKIALNVNEIRDQAPVKTLLNELENRKNFLVIKKDLMEELRSYMNVSRYMPKNVDLNDRESVRGAQEALHRIQSYLDRVLEVQFTVFRVARALSKTETNVKKVLNDIGEITTKTTGPQVKLIVTLVFPELVVHQNNWANVESLCSKLQDHLGNAKDTMRLQIRLDENANWNRRYSGG